LLCRSSRGHPVVYNVPATEQQKQRPAGKVQLTTPGHFVADEGNSNSCFAGDDDELVVAASSDHRLFVWFAPEGIGNRSVNHSLLSFSGHQRPIDQVRYCKAISSLASCDDDGVIKLWTPSSQRFSLRLSSKLH